MRPSRIVAAGAALVALFVGGFVGPAVLSSSSAATVDDQTIFCGSYVPNEKATWAAGKTLAKWASQNPGERDRWSAWADSICGGAPSSTPAMATQHGLTLIAAGQMALPEAPPPTTTTSTTTTQPTTTTTTTQPTTTTTTTTPVGCAVTTPNVPDGPDNAGGCFPGPSNTGPNAPASSMATYTGSCTITTPNVTIDSKVVNCRVLNLASGASGFVLKNSYLNGGITQGGTPSFTVADSFIDSGVQYPAASSGAPAGKYACGDPNNATTDCGVTGSNFTIVRTEIINSNRAAFCEAPGPCLVQDNYFHGTNLWPDKSNLAHASSMREEQNLTLRHNSLHCSYTGPFVNGEIGCSADLTGYPDFAPIKNNTVDGNLFVASSGSGFCAYGGGTNGKPFSGDSTNATNQKFINNVFQRGSNNKCGTYGPVTDFITGRTGNVWSGNVWDNGGAVQPG